MIKFTKKPFSLTKNRLRWTMVLIAMVALLLTVVFASGVFAFRKTVSCLGTNPHPIGKVNGGKPLQQPFTPEQPHVDFIEIRMATNLERSAFEHFHAASLLLALLDVHVLYPHYAPTRI